MKQKQKRYPIRGGLAFLLPILLLLCVLAKGGFYPFGEKSMLIMDMQDQDIAFFSSLRDAFFGDNSLFFSWSRSMGGNYWGLFAFYIASPLSFITLFFPVENLPSAIVLLTLLKVGLCGVSFFVYGKYMAGRFRDTGVWGKWTEPLLLVLSVCYALMSYNMVYSLSLMWLDGVILLPLVLLGVEKIFDGKKGLCYLVALSLLFISNYYTGYMVGIYTAMYVIVQVICRVKKDTWKEWLFKILRFAGLSVLSAGIAAPVIFGALKDLTKGKLAGGGVDFSIDLSQTNYPHFSDLFGKIFQNGEYDSITNAGLPAVYCGIPVLICAVLFFVFRKINLREKIGMFVIAGILGISFYYTSIDMVWHGFQVPNWFPYRYAFLFSFTLVYMACRALLSLPEWKNSRKKFYPATCAVLLIVIACIDMGINADGMLAGLDEEFHYHPISEYEELMDKTKPLIEDIQQKDTDFYRINQGYEYSKNDAMLFGYNGMTHYSSTYNEAINSLTPKLGISQGYFWNSGYGSNAALDSLFAVKYILADKTVPSSYTKRMDSDGAASYDNPLALPIAFGSTTSDMSPELTEMSPFTNQNRYISAVAGTEVSCFTEIAGAPVQDGNGWKYEFTAASENPVYLYMKADGISFADVYVKDEFVGNYFTNETNGTIFLGNFAKGEKVEVRIVADAEGDINLYCSEIAELHMEVLEPVLQNLQKNGIRIKEHKGGKLLGTISLAEGQKIMTSIPYDEGWTVRIDGEKTETEQFAGTFMAIKCPAGEHEIQFSYVSPGVITGMIVSLLSLFASVLYFLMGRIYQALKSRLAPDAMR